MTDAIKNFLKVMILWTFNTPMDLAGKHYPFYPFLHVYAV